MQCCKLLGWAVGFPDVAGPRRVVQIVLSLLCSFFLYRRLKREEKEIPEKGLQSCRANLAPYLEPIHKLSSLKEYHNILARRNIITGQQPQILCHSQILHMPFGPPTSWLQESTLFSFLQVFIFTSHYCKLKPEGKSQWTFGGIKKELEMSVTGLDFLVSC